MKHKISLLISIIVVVVSAAWYYYQPGFEPAIAVLVGLGVLIASLKVKPSEQGSKHELNAPQFMQATEEKEEQKDAVRHVSLTTEPAADFHEKESQEVVYDTELKFADVIYSVDKEKHTELQISQFIDRVKGTYIIWRVRVYSVSRSSSNDGEINIFFEEIEKIDSLFPKSGLAIFDKSEEKDLTPLLKGDLMILKGKLEFMSLGSSENVIIKHAKMVSFEKNA